MNDRDLLRSRQQVGDNRNVQLRTPAAMRGKNLRPALICQTPERRTFPWPEIPRGSHRPLSDRMVLPNRKRPSVPCASTLRSGRFTLPQHPMFKMLIDTCVWLDFAKDSRQVPLLEAAAELMKRGSLSLIVPRVLLDEFRQNRDRIAQESARSLASHF